jgi:glycosyltransferase involved in cell wall biosynthesis
MKPELTQNTKTPGSQPPVSSPPEVSVVMAVYNQGGFVKAAVESVLNQSFQDFEFIIVDDASTDDTDDILQSVGDPHIRLFRNPENQGLTSSLTTGIAAAAGNYIARMDADDISLPQRLEKQIAFLDTHPNVVLMGCNCSIIDHQGRGLGKAVSLPDTDRSLREKLPEFNCFVHGSVMFRRTAFEQVGGYRVGFRDSQDYDLWLRMMEVGGLANSQEVLYKSRIHPDMKSVKHLERQHAFYALAQELHQVRVNHQDDNHLYLSRTKEIMHTNRQDSTLRKQRRAKSTHRLRLGIRYLSNGYILPGIKNMLYAIALNPFISPLLREIQRRRLFSRR